MVLPQGASPPSGQAVLADRAGTVQLYAFFDGSSLHKAVRTLDNGTWTVLIDESASAMTIVLGRNGASFYWSGLDPGDHYGFITAAATGCGDFGLDAALVPQVAVSG